MLRFTLALLAAVVASGTAESADRALPRQSWHHGWHRTTAMLPAGLPRPHYHFRTTISYGGPNSYRRPIPRLSVYEAPEQLYAPEYVEVRYVRPSVVAPPLPGYYDYQDRYYGGPYVPYWDRLPYACGVYGYC